MAESNEEVKVNRSATRSCRTPQMKNNRCGFFGVVVIAWLQSRDSDDAQNLDGGQEGQLWQRQRKVHVTAAKTQLQDEDGDRKSVHMLSINCRSPVSIH